MPGREIGGEGCKVPVEEEVSSLEARVPAELGMLVERVMCDGSELNGFNNEASLVVVDLLVSGFGRLIRRSCAGLADETVDVVTDLSVVVSTRACAIALEDGECLYARTASRICSNA